MTPAPAQLGILCDPGQTEIPVLIASVCSDASGLLASIDRGDTGKIKLAKNGKPKSALTRTTTGSKRDLSRVAPETVDNGALTECLCKVECA
jgi:hypothetical protein